jgi:type I restriction enzyme, S subunit
MNELLLDYFDDIICRAEDVPRLNEAILQLAVRGKLVAQDPADEPAAELLRRIAAEKKRLRIKSKKLPEIGEEERPYCLPDTWEWVRLGNVTNYGTSEKADAESVSPDTWVLDLGDIEKTTSRLIERIRFKDRAFKSSKSVFQSGDVLYGKLRPYLDKVLVADEPGVCTTEIVPIRAYYGIDPHYLRIALKSPHFIMYVNERTFGVKMPRLGTKDAQKALLPLPPLAEQKRIVARVDELLTQTRTLANRLAKAEANLTTLHETAVFHLLHSDTSDDLAAHWQFIADNFDLLYDERYPAAALANVAQLKQAILQLAVRGKLTRQDPNDEPAAALLQHIAAEKKRLGIKSKKLPEIGEEERPFVLPDGWEWVRFGAIADTVSGVTKGRNLSKHETITLPYLRVANVQRGYLDLEVIKEIVVKVGELEKYHLEEGDLLLTEGGDADKLGRSAIWRGEIPNCIHQNHVYRARPIVHELKSEWLMLCTNSPYGRDYFLGASKQTTNLASINMTQLRNFPVILPPLSEQKRIVARVEALLRLCDDLAGRITLAKETGDGLKTAVLGSGS